MRCLTHAVWFGVAMNTVFSGASRAEDTQPTQGAPAEASVPATPDAAPVSAAPSADSAATPAPEPAMQPLPVLATPEAPKPVSEVVTAQFGKGVTFRSKDDKFSLTIRGRMQIRATVEQNPTDETPTDAFFQVRRARLVFTGNILGKDLTYYIQLGMAPLDMEADLPVIVRDAYFTWSGVRDFNIRAGQMKVPHNLQRLVSSSALQFVDRAITNAEFNIDRDVGVQFFSNDLGGLGGRLGYNVGVFGGEGRNRFGEGPGLLYAAHLYVRPFGKFDDVLQESDLSRDARPRLSLGGGFAYNHKAQRERGSIGDFTQLGTYDMMHAEADLSFKVSGFSLLSEFLWRSTNPATRTGEDEAGAPIEEIGRSGMGWMAQAGYLFPTKQEVVLRWAELHPLANRETELSLTREGTVGVNWYIMGHDLKLQADYTATLDDAMVLTKHTVRVQTQVFF